MYFGAQVPNTSVERVMDFAALIEARKAWDRRPPWAAILAKAYGLTAREMPELRRVFLKWPWPRIYEYPVSIAGVTINREYEREPAVFTRLIREPDALKISEIAGIIQDATKAPLNEIREFRRIIEIERLPFVLRRPVWWLGLNFGRWRARLFGTVGITAVSFLGTGVFFTPTPTNLVTLDVFGPDGRVPLRYIFDHRLFDGVAVARALARMEEILSGPILHELRTMAPQAS
jgi:hypothetical protein